ncbi:hypothetical protein I0Q12_10065 [Rhodococcus sp. CX]|uniref:hypothetical protein n=1 Tax=Rhodococcus sp. CX TaxID=2789880 RepID=UPI0018CC8059|nr:hypothetical protein [Rhodococcus sp. CX]MBH0119842.1 hypothetical protein [Rhodococcus sp. CX]
MSYPFEISREHFEYALALLGVEDLSGVRSVLVEPGGVTVTRNRKNVDGECYLHNGGIATEVVQIAVERPKPED